MLLLVILKALIDAAVAAWAAAGGDWRGAVLFAGFAIADFGSAALLVAR